MEKDLAALKLRCEEAGVITEDARRKILEALAREKSLFSTAFAREKSSSTLMAIYSACMGETCGIVSLRVQQHREYEPVYPDGLESWYLDGMQSRSQDTEDPRGPRAGLLAPGTLGECRSLRRAYRCGRKNCANVPEYYHRYYSIDTTVLCQRTRGQCDTIIDTTVSTYPSAHHTLVRTSPPLVNRHAVRRARSPARAPAQ